MYRYDMSGAGSADSRSGSSEYSKDDIQRQLDTFTEKHHLKSLRDRLRIGFNEVAILAYDKTNEKVKEISKS